MPLKNNHQKCLKNVRFFRFCPINTTKTQQAKVRTGITICPKSAKALKTVRNNPPKSAIFIKKSDNFKKLSDEPVKDALNTTVTGFLYCPLT